MFNIECGVANKIWRCSPISYKHVLVFGFWYSPNHAPIKYMCLNKVRYWITNYMFVADPSLVTWTILSWCLWSLPWCQINHEMEHLGCLQFHVFYIRWMKGILVCNNSFLSCLMLKGPSLLNIATHNVYVIQNEGCKAKKQLCEAHLLILIQSSHPYNWCLDMTLWACLVWWCVKTRKLIITIYEWYRKKC